MRFINSSIVKFAFFLTSGILFAHYFQFDLSIIIYLFFGFLVGIFIAWILARKQLFPSIYFGLFTFISFFLLGIISYQIRLPSFQNNHYSQNISSTSNFNSYQLKINEVLKPDLYNEKYLVKIQTINGFKTSGLILLQFKRDSINKFNIDDVLYVAVSLQKIKKPFNPHQFDYSNYMKTLGVYHQINSSEKDILLVISGNPTLRGIAEKVRNHIIDKLHETPITPKEISIIQALILGQRKDISKTLYQEYAAAGAIHILAVSGLHVGIIYFILLFILSPLKRLPRGKFIVSILIIILLWIYAFITGLSPSVIRAVTMFSFFSFASLINRDTNSINTLFLSYFTLLLIQPLWLFHVGFQLSYLAVFFILWVIPLFNKWYYPKNRLIKKLWDILTVTFAAQLGIIPLSLFYFHQFPGLFFITNIVILPFLGIILGSGILIIILATFNILPFWLAASYSYLIKMLNNFINWIANQESFLILDIHFTTEKVIGSYLLIISLILFWKKVNFQRIIFCLISIVLLIITYIWDTYKYSGNELIIFHKNRNTIMSYKQANKMTLFKMDSINNFKNKYPIKSYRIAKNIHTYSEEKLPKVFNYNKKNILFIDSLGVYSKNFEINTVILSLSPEVNLERMIDSLQPKKIIADGNNYTSYVNRWRNTCFEKGIPFHYTGTEGAYVFR